MRRPGRIFAGSGAAPLRRLRRHLPLQGRLLGWQRTKRLPCKGSWMRRKAQTEGCIAALRRNYLARSGRALPYVSQRAVLASSPQTLRRPAVPGFAARVPYIVGRAFTPAGEEVAATGTGRALCSAFPRSAQRFRKAPRRARSPALHCGRKRAAPRKRQPASTPDDGPMQASAPTQGRAAAGRMRQSGRILPPCFAGCVAAGRVRRLGRVFAGSGAAPLRRLRRHLPLQGRLLGWQRTKRLPCKGSWMRRKAQTEGCIAGLRWNYLARSGRALPRSARRFRKAPRRARSPALHCGRKRAATRKRQPASTPDGGPMQASAPTQGAGGGRESAATRKDICKARCGTPPPPAATPPLAGEAFGVATHKKAPLQGELDAPEGAD